MNRWDTESNGRNHLFRADNICITTRPTHDAAAAEAAAYMYAAGAAANADTVGAVAADVAAVTDYESVPNDSMLVNIGK